MLFTLPYVRYLTWIRVLKCCAPDGTAFAIHVREPDSLQLALLSNFRSERIFSPSIHNIILNNLILVRSHPFFRRIGWGNLGLWSLVFSLIIFLLLGVRAFDFDVAYERGTSKGVKRGKPLFLSQLNHQNFINKCTVYNFLKTNTDMITLMH